MAGGWVREKRQEGKAHDEESVRLLERKNP
jgi:hypothetical protein